MAAPTPTNLTISYGSSSSQVVAIPASSTYSIFANAIVKAADFGLRMEAAY